MIELIFCLSKLILRLINRKIQCIVSLWLYHVELTTIKANQACIRSTWHILILLNYLLLRLHTATSKTDQALIPTNSVACILLMSSTIVGY